jgi:hypothetical protein
MLDRKTQWVHYAYSHIHRSTAKMDVLFVIFIVCLIPCVAKFGVPEDDRGNSFGSINS